MMERVWTNLLPLRSLFYMVGPEEMASKSSTLDEVPAYTVNAIPCFFVMIMAELMVGLLKGRKVCDLNTSIIAALQGSTQLLLEYGAKFMQITAYIWVYENLHVIDLDNSRWSTWLFALLSVELGYYWMHRYAHEYHSLWNAHSLHHSSTSMDLSAALRQGVLQSYYGFVFQLPSALFFDPAYFAHHKACNTLFQFFIHTTLIGSLGPLEYIFNTPSHHRVHHRVGKSNNNYGGVLIIYDRLFGTFLPEEEQVDHYGLPIQYTTLDPVSANWEHFRRLINRVHPDKRTLYFYLGLLTKRRVPLKPFECNPAALIKPIPAPKRSLWEEPRPAPRVAYTGDISAKQPMLRAYLLFLSFAATAFTLLALETADTRTYVEAIFVQFVCLSMYSSIGRLMDGFEKGRTINSVRVCYCLSLAGCLATLNLEEEGLLKSNAARGFQAFAAVDALVWCVMYCLCIKRRVTHDKRE